MAEGMEDDILSIEVVSQAVVAPADSPLALARCDSCELLDLLLSLAVARVCAKSGQQVLESIHQDRIAL